jgi:hypothetical protein
VAARLDDEHWNVVRHTAARNVLSLSPECSGRIAGCRRPTAISGEEQVTQQDLGIEPEKWISLDRDVVEAANWSVHALPAIIAEPVEEAPEPLPEPAPLPEEVVPPLEEFVPPPEEVVPSPEEVVPQLEEVVPEPAPLPEEVVPPLEEVVPEPVPLPEEVVSPPEEVVPELVPPPEEIPPPHKKVAPKPPRKPKRRPKPKPPPKLKVRRRREWRPVLAALTAVLLLAGGLGVAVAVVLDQDPSAAEQAEPQTRGPTAGVAGAVVVPDSRGVHHPCTVTGTAEKDALQGTSGDDVLCGLGDDDVLAGGAGADVLLGGAGDDTLVGAPGPDRLDGGPGKDTFRARDGSRDALDGGVGRDRADAGRLDRSARVESLSDPVVVAAGDVACDPLSGSFEAGLGTETRCRQQATAALVESLEPDRVLVLGDVQNEDARYWKYLKSYHPSWGRFREISRPAPGKEEDRYGGGGYRRYWGARARPQGTLWYSFDVGGWHIVSLDSNCPGPLSCDAGSSQEQWLRADLAAHPAACTIAFWHEPRFSSGGESTLSTEPLWQALYDAGAELVLSGHAQNYERFAPLNAAGGLDRGRGIRQFVVGTGGEKLAPFRKLVPGSLIRNARTFGVLVLRLHPRSYDWRFVSERGRFTDAGSADCR